MSVCILCRLAVDNELRLGKLHIKGKIAVHQNCLYLSSNLVQRGNARNGILNFTLNDIEAESKRTRFLKCCYCHKTGANIGCCNTSCRKTFHTNCGIENGAQNQFVGAYKSFCSIHINAYSKRPLSGEKCGICFEMLMKKGSTFCCTKYMYGKCCNNGWYHKDCLQHYANSAGYFFKCPLCNNNETFRLVAFWGITVPDCDASWEANDSYADQLILPNRCTADKCLSAEGRECNMTSLLLYCILCGSNPMHRACTQYTRQDYCCNDCRVIRPGAELSDSDSDDLDPFERLGSMQTAAELATTSRQVNRRSSIKIIHVVDSDSDSEKDLDSDFNRDDSVWDDLRSVEMTAEKENVRERRPNAVATQSPYASLPQRQAAPLSMFNRQSMSSGNRRSDARSNVGQNDDPYGSRIRTRSRSMLFGSRSPEQASAKKCPVTRRPSIKSPLIVRGRLSTRNAAIDNRFAPMHSPFDISCVANRTRARSHK